MPSRFPQYTVLRNGKRVTIRRFAAQDIDNLWQFFQGLPSEMRRFAWDNLGDQALIQSWGTNINYDKVLPLLAIDGDHIVADATLHVKKSGPLRLVGRVKWLIHPDYQGQGLGTALVNDFIDIARHDGLRHLSCMLISDLERDAIRTLEQLGFDAHTYPSYGVDPDGDAHDMVKLTLSL